MTGPEIRREQADRLADYAEVPIAFTVTSRLRFPDEADGVDFRRAVEERVDPPWVKDYDAIRGEGPTRWAKRFDLTNWVVLSAFLGPARVGGAVVAWHTEGVEMLEGRTDLACLWDLRVHPQHRGEGIGSRLVEEAVRWAAERGCRELTVETQDINVPACRCYAARGFRLRDVRPGAYPDLPGETMLLWSLDLSDPRAGNSARPTSPEPGAKKTPTSGGSTTMDTDEPVFRRSAAPENSDPTGTGT